MRQNPDIEPEERPAVEAHGLSKSYQELTALDRIDLTVRRGEIHGLVGPNGAGKTTLLRLLLGLARPDAGTISLLGEPLTADGAAIPDGVGGFVEEPRFYPYLSAAANLQLLARLDGRDAADRIAAALARVGLPGIDAARAGTLSTGTRQRLGIAAALIRDPQLLILDEPGTGLDPHAARELRALITGLCADGVSVLLSSHDLSELQDVCDSFTIVAEGRVVWAGPVAELRERAPAPTYRLRTSDDAGACSVAEGRPGLELAPLTDPWLSLSATGDSLDSYVIALGAAGIAVRLLEVDRAPLEAMFFALTGGAG